MKKSKTQIHLIATIHFDVCGSERLKKALYKERPDIITLEASEKNIRLFEEDFKLNKENYIQYFWHQLVSKGVNNKEIYKWIRHTFRPYSFEYEVALEFSNREKVPLYLIDYEYDFESIKSKTLSYITTILNNCDANKLNRLTYDEIRRKSKADLDLYYYVIEQAYRDSEFRRKLEKNLLDPDRDTIIGMRDITEANNIIGLARQYGPGIKIVHVGGAGHTLDDSKGETLYSILKKEDSLEVSRRTLRSYDY